MCIYIHKYMCIYIFLCIYTNLCQPSPTHTLQHTTTHCNTLQLTATHYTHCNTLQHTATHHHLHQHAETH